MLRGGEQGDPRLAGQEGSPVPSAAAAAVRINQCTGVLELRKRLLCRKRCLVHGISPAERSCAGSMGTGRSRQGRNCPAMQKAIHAGCSVALRAARGHPDLAASLQAAAASGLSAAAPAQQSSSLGELWVLETMQGERGRAVFQLGSRDAAVQVSIPSSPAGGGVVLALREPGAPHVPDLLTLLSSGQLVGFFGPVVRPVAELCVCRQRALSHSALGCSCSAGG